MNTLEEIRSRLPIEEVVGNYVQLKKMGRNFKALCPFHSEKTPSFIVSPEKGMAYCFGCRKGGDIFAFVQEIEQLDFPETVRWLADKAGVTIEQEYRSKEKKEEKETLLEILHEAHRFFQKELDTSAEAKAYLEKRGYQKGDRDRFGLGYSPDSFHTLTQWLKKKGYPSKMILKSGLTAQKNFGDTAIYDRFRHRIMFPIDDPFGKLVGFGGRTLGADPETAKYLNAPETPLYHKGKTLFLFHLAKAAIRERNRAIIVEGYFDALTSHQKGYEETVASLGTALTEEQIKLIGRFTENLIFAFDADTAGQEAASRSIELAQRLGYTASVLLIPSGKDPDEALRTTPKAWEEAVKKSVNAVDYEFQKAFHAGNPKTIAGKKQIVAGLLPILQRLQNSVEREGYVKKLSFELETSPESIWTEFSKHSSKFPRKVIESTQSSGVTTYSRLEHLLGLLINTPELIVQAREHLKPDYLNSDEEKGLYKILFQHYNPAVERGPENDEEQSQKRHLQLLELYTDETYADFSAEEREEEVIRLCEAIRKDYKKKRLRSIRWQLAKEEVARRENLMKEYNALLSDQF